MTNIRKKDAEIEMKNETLQAFDNSTGNRNIAKTSRFSYTCFRIVNMAHCKNIIIVFDA